MIDASHLPFEDNVATTKRVVERAHEKQGKANGKIDAASGG
jgi:fructose/tagatose bisphosphate aldolase